MAEPGDPSPHDHDDLIGFTSPRSLAGSARATEAPKAATWSEPIAHHRDDPTDDLFDDESAPVVVSTATEASAPETPAGRVAESDGTADDFGPLFGEPAADPAPVADAPIPPRPANADFDAPPAPRPVSPRPAPAPESASALPAWARETPRPPKVGSTAFGRAQRSAPPEGAMSLYAIYALILFAVPTFGLAAMIALVSVISRPVPAQDLAASHFIFQKRTLWVAAIGAAIGVVLIAVNLGVFVLFAMAIWVIVRGAAGLIRLAAGRPVENPLTWMI